MIQMKLHLLKGRKKGGYVTFGGVWEKGEAQGAFSLKDNDGTLIPMQSRALAYWPDGSIKWSGHVADSDCMSETVCLEPISKENDTKASDSMKFEETRDSITVHETQKGWDVDTGRMTLTILKASQKDLTADLAENICIDGNCLVQKVYPVFQVEHRSLEDRNLEHKNLERSEKSDNEIADDCTTEKSINRTYTEVIESHGMLESTVMETSGPLQVVFLFRGMHMTGEKPGMPFVIRLYLGAGSREMKIVHTFLFDGNEEKDYLKGMGIRFETTLGGAPINHHIQYAAENRVFHEAAVMLNSSHPRLPEFFKSQMNGEMIDPKLDEKIDEVSENMPVWNRYRLIQDSAYHFEIRKQTKHECCEIKCKQGGRSKGAMSVSGENGCLTVGIRDFWQKYPGELEAQGLGKENGAVTAWFYSPACEAYDFRHYDTRSYPRTGYEGFEDVGASAFGIGVTSECTIQLEEKIMPKKELLSFAERVQNPCVYLGTPEYYHKKKAFGYWSLPHFDNEQEKLLEEQLANAFAFYKQEVENRDWYGLFDYGDVMHSYDSVRHTWRYDVGGFAWQNTELVDTYWLWLYFLRTGREDVFTMAEAMSRHCSEVDTYHFGPLKGLGSRHNVRHWGCSCKEPRIGMAGHNRFLYYLTVDDRMGDVMENVKDADLAMSKNKHNLLTLPDGRVVPGVRSGPDWSSYVSNWMTHYERTLDDFYRKRIETGIADIAATPYGFASGPDYLYDVKDGHLIYNGEIENTPNQHLQICMGGPQIWLEVADLLEDDTLKNLLADLGEFYYLSPEEKSKITEGKIVKRPFSWQFMATGVSAFAAYWKKDKALAKKTWDILFDELKKNAGTEGITPMYYAGGTEHDNCQEISWISTNTISQWCLNVIMGLEFIREFLS